MIHILALSLTLAHAGWFSKFCESMIADDPYQFEQTHDDYLAKEIERLKIRRSWGTAYAYELKVLEIMEIEVRKRAERRSILDARPL